MRRLLLIPLALLGLATAGRLRLGPARRTSTASGRITDAQLDLDHRRQEAPPPQLLDHRLLARDDRASRSATGQDRLLESRARRDRRHAAKRPEVRRRRHDHERHLRQAITARHGLDHRSRRRPDRHVHRRPGLAEPHRPRRRHPREDRLRERRARRRLGPVGPPVTTTTSPANVTTAQRPDHGAQPGLDHGPDDALHDRCGLAQHERLQARRPRPDVLRERRPLRTSSTAHAAAARRPRPRRPPRRPTTTHDDHAEHLRASPARSPRSATLDHRAGRRRTAHAAARSARAHRARPASPSATSSGCTA